MLFRSVKDKVYDMGISGKIISFDDKVYKVNESIADEVTAIMK